MRISDWSSDVCSSDLAPGAAEGGALPHATGDELERAGGDFLARFGDADDDAFTPAAVAAFERGAHHFGITGRIEAIVGAAVGGLDDLCHRLVARQAL